MSNLSTVPALNAFVWTLLKSYRALGVPISLVPIDGSSGVSFEAAVVWTTLAAVVAVVSFAVISVRSPALVLVASPALVTSGFWPAVVATWWRVIRIPVLSPVVLTGW